MTRIIFVEANGTRHEVEAEEGASLMEAAVQNLVPGIDADCGGNCMCATCHVILGAEWTARLDPALDEEKEMLRLTPELTATSRLACQVPVSPALDGMVVQLPEFQM